MENTNRGKGKKKEKEKTDNREMSRQTKTAASSAEVVGEFFGDGGCLLHRELEIIVAI